MTMGVVNVAARHNLQAVTDMGNVTTHTVEFTNPTTSIVASGNVVVDTNTLFVDSVNNRVGVRTTTPSHALNIKAASGDAEVHIQAQGNDGGDAILYFNGASTNQRKCAIISSNVAPNSWCKQDLHFCMETTSDSSDVDITDSKMVITNGGNVGIKTTTPVATLHINGSLYNTAKIELLKRLVVITSGQNQLHPIQPGMQLYESDSRNTWQNYQFPSDSEWLIGTLGSDTVNGGNSSNTDMTISVKANVTAFLIRNISGWSAVTMTGWSSIGTVATLMSGYSTNFEIWARTFTQGTHSMNTYSAMYAFTI